MSAPDNHSWKSGQTGIFTLLLILFIILVFAGGRHFFRNTREDLRTTVHDAGQDLKSTGRDVASSIRDTVQ